MTKPPLLTNVYVSTPFLYVWCESARVRAAACARLYAFMIMCVRRLMMVQVCKAVFLRSEVKWGRGELLE